jgi:hypothetical protein
MIYKIRQKFKNLPWQMPFENRFERNVVKQIYAIAFLRSIQAIF